MAVIGSVDSVIAAIRDDAAAEMERIEKSAAEEIAKVSVPSLPVTEAVAPSSEHAAARRRNAQLIAQAEWEGRRRFIAQREEWIARVIARADELLASAGEDDLARLEDEAREMTRGGACERVPSGGCIARGEGLAFDNSFHERARRFEPQWRRALAALYRP